MDNFINKIICGDCLEIMKDIPDGSVDLVLTDPPYSITAGRGGIIDKRDYLKNLKALSCLDFKPLELLNLIKLKMKVFNGYFFCNKFLVYDYLDFAIKNNYFYDILIVAKLNPIPFFKGHHISDLEYIILIRDNGSFFRSEKGDIKDFLKCFVTNCKKGIHPAEKPIKLIKKYIKVSSNETDLILDPFCGSGTTCLAAEQLGRRWVGIELSEKYCEIARRRIDDYQRQGRLEFS